MLDHDEIKKALEERGVELPEDDPMYALLILNDTLIGSYCDTLNKKVADVLLKHAQLTAMPGQESCKVEPVTPPQLDFDDLRNHTAEVVKSEMHQVQQQLGAPLTLIVYLLLGNTFLLLGIILFRVVGTI